MHQLSSSTVRLLSSSQVITAVVSVVKELVENAIDASATNIEVKLENFGFDKIEVRDNGMGINAADTSVMAVKHYTSKISSHEDLETLQTYGFRGEALGSICSVAEMMLWQKNKVSGHKMALISVLGTAVMNAMAPFEYQCESPEIFIDGYLPKPEADSKLTSVSGSEKSFIFINQRPVHHKDILKIVRLYYNQYKDSSRCYPIFFMNILVPASSVDVNLTPDKTQVLLHNKEFVLEAVENVLKSVYPDPVTKPTCDLDAQPMKDTNTNCFESSSTDELQKTSHENEDRDKQHVSWSPQDNKRTQETQCPQSSSHNHSLNFDLEQVAGKEYSEAHTRSSSSGEGNLMVSTFTGNQKDEVSSCAVSLNPETPGIKNIVSSDELSISDDAWSKGKAFTKDIEPVIVLCPSTVNHSGEKSNETTLDKSHKDNVDQKTTNIITEKSGYVTAYDLMNNRVVRKPVSALDIFTQEHRAEFLSNSPMVPFQEVPSVILELWEKLSEEDKLRYEEKAAKDMQRYKTQTAKVTGETIQGSKESGKKLKLNKSPAQRLKLKTPMSNQQILDKLFHSQIEKKAVEPTVHTVRIDFNLNNLKQQLCKLGRKEMLDFGKITLMSKLNLPGAWVIASKNSVDLLNPYRVEEALLYKRLVEDHKIPVEKLDLPVILNDRLIGGPEYFTALLSMQKDSPRPNGHVYLSDKRLTYNGFQIRMIPDSSELNNPLEIEGMSRSLPFYGISDLKEILSSVIHGNKNLSECRPLKVLNYLEGEAVRLARQLPLNLSKLDVHDTLHRMKSQLSGDQKECIHGRPFFHHLSDIPDSDD
ncbi:PMS1 protein homolog 1 isoform 2-T2 [Leptodactylus fuscus]|uniref:PMS1 protein homolog 1 isoform X2 n=1 Tax=Leptodactylus fuscus TaxID=238119 RepID=UPI003F4EC6E3